MSFRKTGSVTGEVIAVDGGISRVASSAWGEGDSEALAAENEAADEADG